MKPLPRLTLALVVALSAACSSPQDSSAPAEQKSAEQGVVTGKRTQALTGMRLVETPVGAGVLAAAGSHATVRAFRIEGAEGTVGVADVMQPALQAAASDASLAWTQNQERDTEQTRGSLRYLEGLLPAIEAEVGTGEAYRSGSFHHWETLSLDTCRHRDFYGVLFQGVLYTIEAAGDATC